MVAVGPRRLKGRHLQGSIATVGALLLSSLHHCLARDLYSAGWKHHSFFDPLEPCLSPPPALSRLDPPILDPTKGFAKYTLTKRLPAVIERVIHEQAVTGEQETSALRQLEGEIPDTALKRPMEVKEEDGQCVAADAQCFNGEWARWTDARKGAWTEALPLISTEMYLYRRLLDCTGYFRGGETGLVDPYEGQKAESLVAGMGSKAFQEAVSEHVAALKDPPVFKAMVGIKLRRFVHTDLWGNQGDLALSPMHIENTEAASKVSHTDKDDHLLQDESEAAIELLMAAGGKARVDFILDNSGIELLCDLLLADYLLSHKLASEVHLHAKGEPLFISDAMPKDVASHIAALEARGDAAMQHLAANLKRHIEANKLIVKSHMFWTAPRLFWEMPRKLADEVASSTLVLVKGDANYRRLVGDRAWPVTVPLSDIVQPWFPAPMLALRTLKAEIAVGLTHDQAERAKARDEDWMVNGQFAQIQFVPRR
uniref:Sugar phosphate phosphatase n=2 Tax=Hemiselmis andersenii TaxID=464988 RepID=A0A6U4MP20_HEMAN|mmetsp:Transcript_25403/g.58871  ORF Transcript_25403/g.58871 Transcript_25403/m.58871 type:complete len:483 (+) Transcript_25403:263-1711(+)